MASLIRQILGYLKFVFWEIQRFGEWVGRASELIKLEAVNRS